MVHEFCVCSTGGLVSRLSALGRSLKLAAIKRDERGPEGTMTTFALLLCDENKCETKHMRTCTLHTPPHCHRWAYFMPALS